MFVGKEEEASDGGGDDTHVSIVAYSEITYSTYASRPHDGSRTRESSCYSQMTKKMISDYVGYTTYFM